MNTIPENKTHVESTSAQATPNLTRAFIIGLILIPLNVYWVLMAELRWYMILTLNPLFVTPIFYLLVLITLNGILKRISAKLILRPAELVLIYVMLVMSCTIATHDFIINLMSSMGWLAWMNNPGTQWEQVMFPNIPKWLYVWDKEILSGYFNGGANLYEPAILKAWLAPLGFWSIFIFTVGWIMMCMTVILRKAWTEETKLSFPVVRLPLVMTLDSKEDNTLRSPLIWVGFAVAAALELFSGLHPWFPNLPDISPRARWLVFSSSPWYATAPWCWTFYPFGIGLAYLVPLDVSFSIWFFYLLSKVQAIVGVRMGYTPTPYFPYLMEQGIGAWTAFGIALLYAGRRHLKNAFRLAIHPDQVEDSKEPFSYRLAIWGLLAGVVVFVAFWVAAGMSLIWAVVVMLLYLLVAICVTRVRVESGGQHNVWELEPINFFKLFNSEALGPATLAAGAISHWYWRINRSHVMPSQMEAFKLAQEHKIPLKKMVVPLLAAFALAAIVGMWACLHIFYKEGALAKCQGFGNWTNIEMWNWLDISLKTGFKADPNKWIAVGSGASVVVLLTWLRSTFSWFPFHPLGYCIGPGMMWLWCPFMIAWGVKLLVLRYGGLALYRKTLPFFLGLILGDYTMAAIWSIIGIVFNVSTHQIFH